MPLDSPVSGAPGDESGAEGEPEDLATDASTAGPRIRAMRHILASLDRPPDRVVICLPGEDASLRTLEIPSGAVKRVGEVLPFELEALLPFPVEDAVIDYQPLERRDNELRLLACAAPKERVAALVQEVTDAGVFPREMAVGAAALDGLSTLLPFLSESTALLVDVEEQTSDVCVIRDGAPIVTRTLSEGSSNLPRFVSSLRRTLASLRSRQGIGISRAFVLGSSADDPELHAAIEEVTGLPTEPLPLPEAPGAVTDAGRFGRAAALAARSARREKHLNLLRGDFAPQHAMGALRRQAPLFAACIAAVILMFGYSLWARYVMLTDEREALQAQLEAVTESAFGRPARSPERAAEFLEGGGRDEDPLPRYGGYDLVYAMSSIIPDTITHDTRRLNFELDDDGYGARFEIQGTIGAVAERRSLG